jgi:kynureninase
MYEPEELYQHPNALAEFYKHFGVSKRLLLTGHSHQAWPDCGFEGQKQAWLDAAELVDDKWDKAFSKAAVVKRKYLEMLDDDSGNISLSSNTHDLIIRFLSSLSLNKTVNIVTTDGEFHTIRRQLDRLGEEGIEIRKAPCSPADEVIDKLIPKIDNNTAAVLVSKVFFNSGEILNGLSALAEICEKFGTKLLIDAYHALNVVPVSLKKEKLENAFIVGGGYKYCQFGEGNCFLRFPRDISLRPVITGWYSEFGTLSKAKNKEAVLYGSGDELFAGATYDPTSNYRASEVIRFFDEHALTPEFLRKVSRHQILLLAAEFDKLDADPNIITRNRQIDLENIGGFLVMYTPYAGEISDRLKKEGVLTDYRGDRLRFGPAPYLSDYQLTASIGILNNVIKNFYSNNTK